MLLPLVYAVRNKDEVVRERSSSGGIFYELAKHTLEIGGVVYGAVFDKNFQVVHIRGSDMKDIQKMQGSKYVQSNTEGIFESVKSDLLEGKEVLFTGCPCQVDGLRHYLGTCDQERLIMCDLICLGVNSPKVWQDYLSYMADNERIIEVRFRDKLVGWRDTVMNIQMNKTSYIERTEYDYFYQAFYRHLILRDSCFMCKYTNLNRIGDITIGDFWGIENVYPQIDDNKGVSVVLLNSLKGREIFQNIKDAFILKKARMEDAIQPSLQNPANCPEKYDVFWQDYLQYGFPFICKKYLNGDIKGRMKKLIKKGLIKIHIWDCLKR